MWPICSKQAGLILDMSGYLAWRYSEAEASQYCMQTLQPLIASLTLCACNCDAVVRSCQASRHTAGAQIILQLAASVHILSKSDRIAAALGVLTVSFTHRDLVMHPG